MSSNIRFIVLGNENRFTSDEEIMQMLDGILSRTEDNFSNGKNTQEAHEDLKWMMRQTKLGISFDICCEALNKSPEDERFRLLNMYMQKHGKNCNKEEH